MLPHDRLRRYEHESVLDKPPHIVAGLVLGPLERIRAQVEQHGQAQLHHRLCQTSKPCAFCSMNTAFHCS